MEISKKGRMMYRCSECNTKYDLTEDHLKFISDEVEKSTVVETIIICPRCRTKRIIGGEQDWDDIDEKDIIMMFGRDLKKEDLNYKIEEFEGVQIEE
jgi:DNA-directed RNA polymerase subunit RPC12/RpoP